MKTEIADRWIAELRSGKYEQGRSHLNTDGKFCCLGVLCQMVAAEAGINIQTSPLDRSATIYDGSISTLPNRVMDYTGIKSDVGYFTSNTPFTSLVSANDNGKSFVEIADIIEKHKDEL